MSNIKLLNGDCYELLNNIPDKSIDLIIIDPPYEYTTGVGGAFGNKKRNYHEEYMKVATDKKNIIQKYLDKGFSKEKAKLWADKETSRMDIKHISSGFDYKILDILEEKMKETNIYIWCSKWQLQPILKYYIDKGYNFDVITWHKTNPCPTMNNTYANDTEYCVFARKKGVRVYGNYNTKRKYYVSSTNLKDKKLYKHPTIKPLDIIQNFIINSSCENDTVLDCFMGSGTTGVACKNLNRNFIGIEIDKEYFEIAKNRIDEY